MNTTPIPQAVERLVQFFEQLQPQDLQHLPEIYAPEARFKDPFNEVRGSEPIRRVFEHMFEQVASPRFVVREVVAGGDSAGAVASHLGVQALTVVAGLRPGAPLCRAWSDDARRDGLELVLKGGQMGTPAFYGEVLSGVIGD